VAEHRVELTHGDEAGDDDAGLRGSLTVRDRAVSHVAEYAARGVDGVVRQSGGLGAMVGRALPRVDSSVSGSRVRVRVAIATEWPLSVTGVSASVRAEVADALAEYTGLTVDKVDVAVDDVVHDLTPARRVLQ